MRAALGLAFLIATTAMAVAADLGSVADLGPVIVIPSRPGVPVTINGFYASYADDQPPHVGHYYPSSGRLPGYGRLEIEPPSNGRPQQAESYHRSWSAQSAPQPAQPAAPFYPPTAGGLPQNQQYPQYQQNPETGPQNLQHPPQNFQYRKPHTRPQ
jgi:hypothetical protein